MAGTVHKHGAVWETYLTGAGSLLLVAYFSGCY